MDTKGFNIKVPGGIIENNSISNDRNEGETGIQENDFCNEKKESFI